MWCDPPHCISESFAFVVVWDVEYICYPITCLIHVLLLRLHLHYLHFWCCVYLFGCCFVFVVCVVGLWQYLVQHPRARVCLGV